MASCTQSLKDLLEVGCLLIMVDVMVILLRTLLNHIEWLEKQLNWDKLA